MKDKIAKTIFIILAMTFLTLLVGFYLLGIKSQTGKAPGFVSGHLSACPDTPNCIGSEFPDDHSHHIAPLRYPAAMTKDTMDLISKVIQELGGEVTAEEGEYLSAIFTSAFWGFLDDVEIRNDRITHTIHVRSASRVGHSDFGENKKRVTLIADLFNQKIKAAR